MEKNELKLLLEETEGAVIERYVKPKSALEYELFWTLGELCTRPMELSDLKKIAVKTRRDLNYLNDAMRAVSEYSSFEDMMFNIGTQPLRSFRGEHWPKPPVAHPKCEMCGKAR